MRKLFGFVPVLLLLLLPAPARAADNGSWSVYPASTAVAARPYFFVSADPGHTVRDRVVVANKTDQPMKFRLYAADAYNTARDGGFAVKSVGEKMLGVGAWARLPGSSVSVPARGTVTVPFTIQVPEGAEPGDHPGAIVALDEKVEKSGGGVALGVQRAVGARVYLQVTGVSLRALAVEDVQISQDRPLVPGFGDSTATVSYTLHNTGNVTLDPRVRLKATGLFGRTLLSRELTKVPAELLPGQRVRLMERWGGAPQLDRGEVTLTASATGTEEKASTSFLAVPWLPVGVASVAVGAGVWLLVKRRQHHPRGARGTARPATAEPRIDTVPRP
ncbi:WxL protein peptidoglycan domain-containing protein [Streptomyces acidiscabies]|uniref:COG1470 family protein n=1 Tax=Streptomyces acidiscabies TaxID=42234 RepID=UPI0038F630EB